MHMVIRLYTTTCNCDKYYEPINKVDLYVNQIVYSYQVELYTLSLLDKFP